MSEQSATPSAPPDQQAALLAEAANKSGLLWVDVPGDRAWPAWHVWVEGTAYVVSGPGEQTLPALPQDVVLVLRSKDTGGRLLRVAARAEPLTPPDPRWEPAANALQAARLNAPAGDVVGRWAAEATVTALVPHGAPSRGPAGTTTRRAPPRRRPRRPRPAPGGRGTSRAGRSGAAARAEPRRRACTRRASLCDVSTP